MNDAARLPLHANAALDFSSVRSSEPRAVHYKDVLHTWRPAHLVQPV